MAKDLPEEIASSQLAPINRTASQVTRTGAHWDYKIREDEVWSDLPLPTRAASGPFVLTGRVFGRLTVVGLGVTPPGRRVKEGRWVVRCQCGSYSHRKAKSLREGASLMCSRCRKVEFMRAGEVR